MCHSNIETNNALGERIFQGTIATLELFAVYLGKELGLYRALDEHGPATSKALAARTGLIERYVREWLEQQAVASFLDVDAPDKPASERSYRLPPAHAGVLADPDHSAHAAPFAQMLVGIAAALPEVAKAYRHGGGVAYERYGKAFRDGQSGINRPAFGQDLVATWLEGIADVRDRLAAGESLRIADVGCGEGWAAIALARAFPMATVVGYDLDLASIEAARRHAEARGARVRFVHGDAAELEPDARFDLVLLLEALHDFSHPVQALARIRRVLAEDGTLLVADERVAERFTAPGDATERMMYGWSISHCLPVALAEPGALGIGTAIRPSMVEQLGRDAGFTRFQILDVQNELFRFYRLG